ncbi:MAG: signal peptide peptidase SppA [Gammaproteobacteria bacterium]
MAATPTALGRFFGGMLRLYRIIRSLIFNILFLVLVLGLVIAMIGQPPQVVHHGSTLLLNPGAIVEQESLGSPLEMLSSGGSRLEKGEALLPDLLRVIAAAKDDDRIKAMLIMTDPLNKVGLSQLKDLEQAIADFKTSGKKVYAWGSSFHQGQYLLASTADEILMNNFGDVGLEGFGIWQNYFQSALNKLGVNVHIFRVGAYKSAVEPYSRSNMSEESRSNYTKLLGDLWTDFVHDVETNRKLKPGTVNDYINHFDQHLADYKGNSAELAKALGLVDRIDSPPDALAYLKQQIGTRGEDLNTIDFRDYLHAVPAKVLSTSHKIAVIVADGEIVDGEAQPGSIGGDTLAALIRKAAQDDGVKALVLRINSPGGSAFASELIRSELVAFKANGRPLVVSMGDTAASGGYWIASAANKIIASPVTLTGSIGIFGTMFTLEESFNKLGIGTDGVGTTELAGYSAIGRPLTPMAGRALQLQIEHGYEKFLTLVSESRDLDHAQADAVGQGQVWTGKAALEKKLIDAYGNQQDAIKAAAALANLEQYQVDVRAPSLSPLQQFIKRLAENEQAQTLLTPLLKSYFTLSPVQLFLHKAEAELGWLARANDPQHVYVRCLECDSVKL